MKWTALANIFNGNQVIAPAMVDIPMTIQLAYGKEARENFIKNIPLGFG